ncbi:tyrosine decarboxylase, partial [mine drainage metagenome]
VRLREEYARRGVSFYLHVDAAFGGYGAALFRDESGRFLAYEELQGRMAELGLDRWGKDLPSRTVWAAYRALSDVDSVTIDPHKMGYVPYSAGGIALRDRRILGLVSYSAAYVFDAANPLDMNLGSVILEGSKAGATAAAVWAAHRLVPLDIRGYGQIVARSIGGAYHFIKTLESMHEFVAGGQKIVCEPLLAQPDFNVVCMAYNFKGNSSLRKMNRLNEAIYHESSYESGPLYNDEWITSHTVLDKEIYGDAPKSFLDRLGIGPKEWDRIGSVNVLRSVVMHPWIANNSTYPERWESYLSIVKKDIDRIVSHSRGRAGKDGRRGHGPKLRGPETT